MSGGQRSDHEPGMGLEANTKRVFDASVAGLDGATRSRLAQARAQALAAAAQPAGRGLSRAGAGRLAAVGAAAAIAAAVAWLPERLPTSTPATAVSLAAFDDLDILLDEEELALFEELEFYAWLDAQAAEGADPADPDGSG